MRETAVAVVMMIAACAVHAADPVEQVLPDMVVTPTGQEVASARIGHSVSVVTAEDINAHGWRTLPEALRAIPGLHISQSGAPGSTVGMVIRGSRSSQVLVLVDGVRLNDPSNPTREAEIATLDLNHVERIEVLRGPQSGLYGSDALAGVVNIVTRRAEEEGLTASGSIEAGSYRTWRTAATLHSGTDRVSAAASVAFTKSDGFSSANKRFPGNEEDDGMESLNLSASVGLQATDSLYLEGRLQAILSEVEYDNGGGPFADADNLAKNEHILTGLRARIGKKDATWQQTIDMNLSYFDREFRDDWGRISYQGDMMDAEWRHDVRIGKHHRVSAGVNARDERAKTDDLQRVSAYNIAVFLQDHATYGNADLVTGLRYDQHEEFGGELTWRAAPSYLINKTGTRFRGSVGTGFKAPSLYQLYAPDVGWGAMGNPDLDPETSLAWDLGFEQSLLKNRLAAGVTYFASRVKDQIEFVNGYENVSQVDAKGVEVFMRWQPIDILRLTASYTRTEAEDRDSGEDLIRIPKDRATLLADVQITPRLQWGTSLLYKGAFDDRYYDSSLFSVVDARVDSSIVVNMSAHMTLNERVTVFGRIDNLFDEEYEEIYGYGTAGRSGYAGIRVSL